MDTRGLLLGGVAAFIAVVSAHAAEIPVKAKPIQYVKVCSLYGDGFYYIPGTQTCMKIGGFVRA
jgi:Porin subfamily